MLFKTIPLSAKIILGLILGILLGMQAQVMFPLINVLATAFVTLLQMTALPYISLSLIVGVAGLSAKNINKPLFYTATALLGLITLTLLFIFIAPIAFPDWKNAEFYSANTIKPMSDVDWISFFIPANPFYAFANNMIPAVVFFSIFVGVGLMAIKNKKHTLMMLGSLQHAVANISAMIMRLAPIGVFCLGWRAATTIESAQIDGLVVYIITAIVIVLLLVFLVLPLAVASITPFTYKQILKVSREAMITAFATGSFFVVIPVLVEKTKILLNTTKNISPEPLKVPDIIIPMTFSLPIGGKLLALFFVLFAAWFSGAYTSTSDYFSLILVGIPQLFGSSTLAMRNLLELFNVSDTMFEVFLVAENLIAGRLSALLSVMFAVCLPLLIVTGMQNKFTFKWRLFSKNIIFIPLICLVALLILRYSFDTITYQYQGYNKFIERDFLYSEVETSYLDEPDKNAALLYQPASVLTRIKQRGFLRVGYFRDDLPYSFKNNNGKLVGFDIEIFNRLARDLDVNIEFVRIFHDQAKPLLANGYLDITSGIPVIPNNIAEYTLTVPYSEQHLAFVVKDKRRAEFTQWSNIRYREDLTIGIPESFFYGKAVNSYFNTGNAWEISTPRLFFKEEFKHIDAMLYGAAAASAWTLLYPEYTVVVPKPAVNPLFMAFPISHDDQEFELYMRSWLEMKKQNQEIERLFDYWIKGQTPLTHKMNAE
jgi:Na+/H+-dicarboxylate symporter